jgi:hypothetical protein
MADFDAQLPVRTIASEFTTEVANAAGTTINPAEDYAQGSTTSGQNGVLAQGAVTTAAPTYVTGQTSPLSLDTSGNLRVSATLTPSGTQNVNVLQWDTTALGVPTAYGTAPVTGNYIGVNAFVTNTVAISAASLPLPTGASTSALQTTGNTSLATIATTLTLAQGSTTSGQTGNLAMGAVTTAAPTYVTGQSDPLSLDTAGNLRVAATLTNSPVVLTYFTDAAVATSATVTHSLAGPVTLDGIWASGSGEIKVTIAIGVTASEVTLVNGFTSSANQNFNFSMKNGYVIPVGSSCKITIKNRDTAAQDVYLTFVSH